MSLYNSLFGVNPVAGQLLVLLDLTPDDTGRFRDCYGDFDSEGRPFIVVFTRNGGGNRDDYAEVFERLRAHPGYMRDFDDDFDPTYASIEFRVSAQLEPMLREVLALAYAEAPGTAVAPMQKFRLLLDKLRAGDTTDPEVQRALEVGRRVLAPVVDAFAKPDDT